MSWRSRFAPAGPKWLSLEALDGTVNPKGTAAALGRDFLAHFVLTQGYAEFGFG